ncbi:MULTISPECIES: response regulator [Crocosphaera]|uniref:Response regulator receiver protein in cluster with DNA polymerase III epsilon subunit n=4 Tax=Crocosphaera watsonii TaxID=263511 RepID=T2JKV6_CROWT|nr:MULTISPECIES: response regulator [Crocosphaera]EHJ13760.1 two-component response regulator [Crocosphaera watsonii WH 0003]MCH2246437.1 response regulator [Crocosphaera sp.]NQZ64307.1 response regulator [Crocosphaera sp.]CCQ58894.1 Response regulator receiver protein in cluster with DNA polymerase III epsilon subunit [Crocosphaera watsonii WH 0005]CCQ66473.1 Response regulator receiver protein in cluster with DNA polymerase III epsilon subunit [Crocosphaera watsonii WH 0402]
MKKILIVDDEPNILILMEQILEELEDEGILILTAKNGKEALEIIQQEKPSLVFLDIMMPYVSGLEVCKRVKEHDNLSHVYIILLTARGQSFDKESGMNAGADLYITKPFRPKDVLLKSKEILGISNV